LIAGAALLLASGIIGARAASATGTVSTATAPMVPAPAPVASGRVRHFHAVDADNHNILINRPGMVTLVLCTSEDSQDAARDAGRAVYPFQGRADFCLIVVVDLRDSIASWVPSIVTSRMRVSLDQEAVELKPWFLKNGNKGNPRPTSHVIPDFSGVICPQLGWSDKSDKLRAILYGADGREIKRLDDAEDMAVLQEEVRKAVQTLIDAEQARLAEAAKTPGSKPLRPVYQHPPLISYTPWPAKKAGSD
jgi:hypothetical protein